MEHVASEIFYLLIKRHRKALYNKCVHIFSSVGGNGVMPVIRIRQMQITEKRTIQVENPTARDQQRETSEEEDYQMILNPDIVGGKKDGCKSSNARTV